jgi:hypothetical protein
MAGRHGEGRTPTETMTMGEVGLIGRRGKGGAITVSK